MKERLIFPMEERYEEYLSDESRLQGNADSISFPAAEAEVIQIVKAMAAAGTGITIQSGKTGIVGGAVPMGGHVMNLSGLCACKDVEERPDGSCLITVESGLRLMDLNREIGRRFRSKQRFWPPQPTETSAAVGGILACAAQGINAGYYGDSRAYVERIRMVLSDGTAVQINRGDQIIVAGDERIDELDLILGGEGLFGVITEAALKLLPKPEEIWGIGFFFEADEHAGAFARQLRAMAGTQEEPGRSERAWIEAAEYLDRASLDLIEKRKSTMTKIKDLPDIDPSFAAMIYLELAGAEESIGELAEQLMELAAETGSDPDWAWAVSGETEVEKMRAFRHAAAETVNLTIEEIRRTKPQITKLGTDIALSKWELADALSYYRSEMKAEGLSGCVFGHIMGTHLHVNILPGDDEAYLRGKALIRKWSEQAAADGAVIAVEHGLGKLKNHLADLAFSEARIRAVKELKEKYDPIQMWNRGNVFPEGSL